MTGRSFAAWLSTLTVVLVLCLPSAPPRAEDSSFSAAEKAYCLRLQRLFAGAVDAAYRLGDAAFAVEESVYGTIAVEAARNHVQATVAEAWREIAILEREVTKLEPPAPATTGAETPQFLEDLTVTLRKFPNVLRGQIAALERLGAAGFGGDHVEFERHSSAGVQDDAFLESVQGALLASSRVTSDPTMPETMLIGAMFESNNAQVLYGRALANFERARRLEAFSQGLEKARSALERSDAALVSTLAASDRVREVMAATSGTIDGPLGDRIAGSYRDAVEVEQQLNQNLRAAFDLVEQGAYAPGYFESPALWARLDAIDAEVAVAELRRGALYDARTQLFQEMRPPEGEG